MMHKHMEILVIEYKREFVWFFFFFFKENNLNEFTEKVLQEKLCTMVQI